MIWLRRVLAITLILLFVTAFISLFLTTHLSDTLGSSGFYKGQLRHADVYNWVYDDLAPVALDEFDQHQESGLPIPLHVIKDDLVSVTRQTLPPEWLENKADSALGEIIPYIVGDRASFTIEIQLRERIDILAPAVVEAASKPEIYDYLTYELISSQILSEIGQAVTLPFEVTISHGEVYAAITQTLPPSWAQARLSEIVYELAGYMKGDTERIDIVVDLTDSKPAALDRIAVLADERLQAAFSALPECSQGDFQQALLNLAPGTLPDCRAVGLDYEGFKAALGIDVASFVGVYIGDRIPGSWVYTDEQLRDALGEDNSDLLDKGRDLIADSDTLTEADLRDAISDDDDRDLEAFDDARHRIHSFRTWLWALWLIPILLLVSIGFLGGRTWRAKLAWAFAVLFLTCLVVFITLAVIRSTVIDDHTRTLVGDPANRQGVELVITEKGNEIAHHAFDSLASGMQGKALYITIGSGLVLLGIIVWTVVELRRRR